MTTDNPQSPELDLSQQRALKRMTMSETAPTFQPQKSYLPVNSYAEDIGDYFALSWIGQVLDQKNYKHNL